MKTFKQPIKLSVTGTVTNITLVEAAYHASMQNGNQYFLELVEPNGKTHSLKMNENFFTEYKLGEKLFVNNIVTVTLEEQIEGVTGYMDGDEELPHSTNFLALVGVVNTPKVNIMSLFNEMRPELLVVIVKDIIADREAHVVADTEKKFYGVKDTGADLDVDALKSLIDVHLAKYPGVVSKRGKESVTLSINGFIERLTVLDAKEGTAAKAKVKEVLK